MEYPRTKLGEQYRRFQEGWFEQFPWLEYSPNKDAAFFFLCLLFQGKEAHFDAFTVDDFRCWKRVNDGKRCALLMYTGSPTSPHNKAVESMSALMNVSGHIDKVMNVQTLEEVKKNRLRLTTTIESIRWLCLQGCALRGNDESSYSKNQDNLIEMIKFMEKIDVNINNVVLEKTPKNTKYTSPDIQREILHILAEIVRKKIREEVGSAKLCLLIDEAKDISNKEQMTIVLRFIDREGFSMECFFDIVHVSDTTAITLKKEICNVLGRYDLHIKDTRWVKDMMELAICVAHGTDCRLFSEASSKRHAEFQSAQAIEIATMVATGTGLNHIGVLCNELERRVGVLILSRFALSSFERKVFGHFKCNDFVSTTKYLLHTLREKGYDILLMIMQSVCENNGIEIPDMNTWYRSAIGRSFQQRNSITVEHHYRFDVFNVAIDFQVEELNCRFDDGALELFRLSSALEPRDNFKLFNDDDIYNLAEKLYPSDFNKQELHYLKSQLDHYKFDIIHHEMFQNICTISELCRRLLETKKAHHYHLIDRLICLVLTRHVSTATIERSFSAMKLLKTSLRNKMEEELLTDSMIVYIEREFTAMIDIDSIIDEFYSMKNRRAHL